MKSPVTEDSRRWQHMAEGSSPLKDEILAASFPEILGKNGQCQDSRGEAPSYPEVG